MGFFKTLFSVCSGTSSFPGFLNANPFRAFAHLTALSLLASVFISLCSFVSTLSDSLRVAGVLSDYFGYVLIKPDGAFPGKPVDKPLTVILSPDARLDYFPSAASADLSGMDDWKGLRGVIWTPDLVLNWNRLSVSGGTASYLVIPMLPRGGLEFQVLERAKLEAKLKETKWKPDAHPASSVEFKSLAISLSVFGGLLAFVLCFALMLLFVSVSVLLFSAVQYFWVSGLSPKLRFPGVLSISIYSAFPAIVIASLAPAFNIPFLSFHMVFFVCFFIYHMMAFNAVQKFLAPPNQGKPSSWDDDDGF